MPVNRRQDACAPTMQAAEQSAVLEDVRQSARRIFDLVSPELELVEE